MGNCAFTRGNNCIDNAWGSMTDAEQTAFLDDKRTCSTFACGTDCAVDCSADCPTGAQCVDWHNANSSSTLYDDYCTFMHYISTYTPSDLITEIGVLDTAGTLPEAWQHFTLAVDFVNGDFSAPDSVQEYTPGVEGYLSGTCASNCATAADSTTCAALTGDYLTSFQGSVCTIASLLDVYTPDSLATALLGVYDDTSATLPDAWSNFTFTVTVDSSLTLVDISVTSEGGVDSTSSSEGFCMLTTGLPAVNLLHILVVFPFLYYLSTLLKPQYPQVSQAAMVIAVVGILYHYSLASQKMQ